MTTMQNASPFSIFADNLNRLPPARAATALATLEEVRLGSVLWDATRTGIVSVTDRMRQSEMVRRTTGATGNAVKKAWAWTSDRASPMVEKVRELPASRETADWLKRQYEKTAPARDWVRGKSAAAWEAERIEDAISKRAIELSTCAPADLRKMLVSALCDALRVHAPANVTAPGDEWYDAVFRRLAKTFKVDAAGLKGALLVDRVIDAIWDDVVKRVKKSLEKMTPEERYRVAENIVSTLEKENMSPEERRDVARAFGADEITAETVEAALKSGAVLVGGYGAMVAAGFGLYIAATTIVHAVATTMLGVTLPFGFYTGMTTGLSLLLNPVVALALAGGGAWWFKTRSERQLSARLAGLTVMEITVAGGRNV